MTTFIVTSSVSVGTSADCMYSLKSLLVTAGWVVISSSNGSAFQAGDLITSGSVLANNNAWFVIKQPLAATASYGGVRREFGFQRTTNTKDWIVTYSYISGHTAGASATNLPSGSDLQYIMSGAAGNSTFDIFPNDGSYRYYAGADTASPFGVWGVAAPHGGGNPTHAFFIEPMSTGTYGNDTDPYVFYVDGTTALIGDPATVSTGDGLTQFQSSSTNQRLPRGWTAKNTASETWGAICAFALTGNDTNGQKTTWPGNAGINPLDGTDDCVPIFWGRPSANNTGATGFKGVSNYIHWRASPSRTTLNTLTLVSNRDYIVMRDVVLPWSGSNTGSGSFTVPQP